MHSNQSLNVGEDDLHAFVDGQLPSARHREVMAYLAVHPDAADRVSGFFRQRVELAGLREQLDDSEPEAERPDLERALYRAVHGQRRTRRLMAAGSALAILLVSVSGLWLYMDPGRRAPSVGAGLPNQAEVELGRGLLAQADLVAAEPGDPALLWLQAHLGGRSLKEPNLEALGLHYLGGNVLTSARAPAVRLLYADEASRKFHLFVGVTQSGAELAALLVPEDHISLTWRRDSLVFSLIAPKESARLLEIMRSTGDLFDADAVSAAVNLGQGDTASAALGTPAGNEIGTDRLVEPRGLGPTTLPSHKPL